MNCSQTNSRLVAYLSDEITVLEKESIQAHLAGCALCREELQALSGLEIRLGRHLHLRAERVSPAPQAWKALQTRIGQDRAGPMTGAFRSIIAPFWLDRPAARRLALAALVILLLLWSAPPVRTLAARLGDWVGSWFQFDTPGTGSSMGIGGFYAFTPFAPQYLPEGFDSSGSGGTSAPDFDRLVLTYSADPLFVNLVQSKGAGAEVLPQGENRVINGNPGVFVRLFVTSGEQLQREIPGVPLVTSFDYRATSLLAWRSGEVRIELVSNLPEEEILKIARALEVVETSPADFPPNQAP